MLTRLDLVKWYHAGGARYTLARALGAGITGERPLDPGAARGAAREIFAGGRDAEIASAYHDLVRGLLRPVDGGYVERMREAIFEAIERGEILVYEVRIVGDSVRRDAKTPAGPPADEEAPAPPPPPPPPPAKKKVVQITAKVPGTRGKRKAANKRPADDLRSSAVDDDSLVTNPPAVLVRGCNDVVLTAVTSPADQPVNWSVAPNHNTESAPALTPTDGGKKATLKTDKAGSFAVTAELDGEKVIWNVVFVWVKVDVSSTLVTKRNARYADNGSGGGWTRFRSGQFTKGNYAWEAGVKMEVLGGDDDQKLGVGKVKIHILQNGYADTLTGNYTGGGTALEVPKGGFPVLDATEAASPYITNGTAGYVKPSNKSISDASKDRYWWSGDSPAGSFPTAHKNAGTALKTISGKNRFHTMVVSASNDAPHSIVAHAQCTWAADFSGDVDAAGTYTPKGKTTGDTTFTLISDATGGQDAYEAGYETFPPVFNDGTDTTWTP